MQIVMMNTDDLVPYINNAKKHPEEQIAQIIESIEAFGFNDPIAVDANNMIIEGHGRLIAARRMKVKEVPVIVLSHLSDKQKKAYILAHNKLTMNTDFNFDVLDAEPLEISEMNIGDEFDIDMANFGFSDDSETTDPDEEECEGNCSDKSKCITCPECGAEVYV